MTSEELQTVLLDWTLTNDHEYFLETNLQGNLSENSFFEVPHHSQSKFKAGQLAGATCCMPSNVAMDNTIYRNHIHPH